MSIQQDDAWCYLKESGDLVEQDLADIVCPLIPSYAVLWARFIGNQGARIASAYPLLGMDRLGDEGLRRDIEERFEVVCASHYTMFTHVYSAQKKLAQAKTLELSGAPRTGFGHADYFEVLEEFYFHFGIVLTQLERIWAAIDGLDPDDRELRKQVALKFNVQFTEAAWRVQRTELYDILDNTRNAIEHYARAGIMIDQAQNRYFVKLPRDKEERWSKYRQREGQEAPATEVMEHDFTQLLAFVKLCYPILIEKLMTFLTTHGLQASAEAAFHEWRANRTARDTEPLPSLSADTSSSRSSSGTGKIRTTSSNVSGDAGRS